MERPAFGNLEKTFLILVSFIPLINGMTFVYMGSKESNFKWIIEGFIYELPWIILILFVYNDDMGSLIAELGLLFMFICLIRTIYVSFTYKKEIIPGSGHLRKLSSSLWVIFSLLFFINGIGLIIVGFKRNVRRWILEGALFELLWALYFIFYGFGEGIRNFAISIAIIGWILSIAITIMVYFEEKRMDNMDLDSSPEPMVSSPKVDTNPETVENTNNSEVIPQFRHYISEIDNLKDSFDKKEENILGLINKRFENQSLTYDRFTSVIDNCHKLFYHNADSAKSIIEMAPEYTVRLDESVKEKINILKSIIEEMNHLIEELILHDGDDESDDELKELFANMDNLINSVKDYK